ncbi:MAG: heat-shock protein Hsp20 [Candidatus Sericytochromatia bacterium]|nr:MAG: heat-shock protein Hsp20 [Candidatus Sericytochromatia bacterium]
MFFDFESAFRELENLRNEIDNIFNRSNYYRYSTFPLVNMYENNDSLQLVAELPGVNKDDINITLNNDILTLSGKREEKKYAEKVETLRNERSFGNFEKSFRLPVLVKKDEITANFADGLLTINLPKAEEAKPKKITIQA